ncbi:hypothetical protein CUC08_Gglean010537 [Alternaria sp. MG1]|nr:hypothetical protein CUC08_Gglean010537 [Alternaria sp. MG1]
MQPPILISLGKDHQPAYRRRLDKEKKVKSLIQMQNVMPIPSIIYTTSQHLLISIPKDLLGTLHKHISRLPPFPLHLLLHLAILPRRQMRRHRRDRRKRHIRTIRREGHSCFRST